MTKLTTIAIISAILIVATITLILTLGGARITQMTALTSNLVSIDYHHACLDWDSKTGCEKETPPLTSCSNQLLKPSLPSPDTSCLKNMPTTAYAGERYGSQTPENIEVTQKQWQCANDECDKVDLIDVQVVTNPGVESTVTNPDGSTVRKVSYTYTPSYNSLEDSPECWTVTNEYGTFKKGESKVIDECTTIKNVDFFGYMRGGLVDGWSNWVFLISRDCLFIENTDNRTELIFGKPYTAKASYVYLLPTLKMCGGIEGKAEEIGHFTGTVLYRFNKTIDFQKGCNYIETNIPTDKLLKVQYQFNSIILTSSGNIMGTPFRWTYKRVAEDQYTQQSISSNYVCPSYINKTKQGVVVLPTPAPTTPAVTTTPTMPPPVIKPTTYLTLYIVLGVILFAVAGIITTIVLMRKKR